MLADLQRVYVLEPRRISGMQCVAVEDGQVIGVIMASSNSDPPAGGANPTVDETETIQALRKDRGLRQFIDFSSEYSAFIASQASNFDGSLTIFAVTEACRGKGVGKALLEKARTYWKAHGAKRIYLYTDETCNTGLYDHLGFERLDAQRFGMEINGQADSLGVYFYGYTV